MSALRYSAASLAVAALTVLGVGLAQNAGGLLSAPLNTAPKLPAARADASCHADGKLQDKSCTPGVINPEVTQANIQQTICVKDFSTSLRTKYAPETYTEALKKLQINEYGYTDKNPARYEEDHLISLEIGGHPDDPRNLWPESPQSPNPKDKIEDMLHEEVCAGKITLAGAQRQISTNWTAIQAVK